MEKKKNRKTVGAEKYREKHTKKKLQNANLKSEQHRRFTEDSNRIFFGELYRRLSLSRRARLRGKEVRSFRKKGRSEETRLYMYVCASVTRARAPAHTRAR